ncbi:MAG TPA: hypothetical protein VMJ10_37930 [Kofleriaceae bacterium]|nr:hypothetical protein [Kofleriaceae bacterium]
MNELFVAADYAVGADTEDCGFESSWRFGHNGPCLTLAKALQHVVTPCTTIWVAPDASGVASREESYPIHLSGDVQLYAATTDDSGNVIANDTNDTGLGPCFGGSAGVPAFVVDASGGGASITGFTIDGSCGAGGASDALDVADQLTLYNVRIANVARGIEVSAGGDVRADSVTIDKIAGDGVSCSSTDPLHPAQFDAGHLVVAAAHGRDIAASDNCELWLHDNSTLGADPSVCESPRPDVYGIWAESSATVNANLTTISCMASDGVHLAAGDGAGVPQVGLGGNIIQGSSFAGVAIEAGAAIDSGYPAASSLVANTCDVVAADPSAFSAKTVSPVTIRATCP